MAVPDELIREVGSLLGYNVDPEDWLFPTSAQVSQWLTEGQRDLAARLVPDAIPELVRKYTGSTTDAAAGYQPVPGARIVAVSIVGRDAVHTPLAQWETAQDDGSLFGGSATSPKWTLGHLGEFLTWPEGQYSIYYIFADFTSTGYDILIGRHLWPLLVSYAVAKAKQADEDDVGAQAGRSEYENAIAGINASNAGRQGILVQQAQKDGTGR